MIKLKLTWMVHQYKCKARLHERALIAQATKEARSSETKKNVPNPSNS